MDFLGKNIPKLGFGLMRLPMLDGEVDIEQTGRMVDLFLASGFTYFDTAYGYIGGKSEAAAKTCIVDRYPRERFQLATKLPAWDVSTADEAKAMLDTSLRRTGAGYFDFYLLHSLGDSRTQVFEDYGIWDFVQEQKAKGILKHVGFSLHDTAEALDEILTKHPEAEFVQLQINYNDWESESVQARKCYEVAMKHKTPVIVMEPVKGGSLATLPEPAAGILRAANPEVSLSSYSKHGFNIHGVVFDELHTQPNWKLFDVMTKGSGDARMQPLYFLITTAGTDTQSICYETHQKARDILEGRKRDATFYPVIYGAKEEDDWTDPKVWKKANPSLGITVGLDKVQAACESAKQNPAEENSFRQLRLNQWVKQAVRWMPMAKWDACAFPVDEARLEGRVCYGGLDLSSTTDITAFVLIFPPDDEDGKYEVLPFFWIPEDNIGLRVRRDHVNYDLWEKQGALLTTEGNVVHYGFIERFIEELGTRFNIREIAFDRWGAVQMTQNLEGLGFNVVPFGQGFKDMSPPTKELMKLALEQKLAHGGHPVLRWMMDNIYVRTDPAGNIKPDKEKSTEKIDGAVATVMALDRAIRNENGAGSVYDTRGLLVLD